MTSGLPDQKKEWIELGRSTSSPKENTDRAIVELDDYYVVIGFEVNNPKAFMDKTHDLAVDYGHAFYYVVKNSLISKALSFGPGDEGKIGWFNSGRPAPIKDGYMNSRPGDVDYPIRETVKAFKIALTPAQGRILELETEKFREKVKSGKEKYTAYLNDTCAESARDLLDAADIRTPSGSGRVKHSDILSFPIAYAINPYMWYSNFVDEGISEMVMELGEDEEWQPPVGEIDPIFGSAS